ncbi:TPA: 50S ribosome-binding GTPase [Pseudomonas aeruginosa]|uniref:Labile enterotoxin output A n=2 Tax=Pseudomonas aeruginosa TaxID=287 RepID=A0A241XMX4_PSEAI|nr:LeoA/HP0731 family dynamin-like GTPase [Pseudomonas aeruginosa]AMA36931.1 labile enterotoxin output A [Pseudomonas aeruginosa DHS01]AWE85857.1 50S ribosome-binding GTPase family protein [Pseudomonas aeruginosa]AWR41704.1 labile enterotoxin output A [Pseudomonas aeruginosa]EIU5014302.1 labile enterotoxin output A [Pseudomonas aeruginosa]EIZ7650057.1 50S ribosome-binding GTPase [Pseudomonas aeruginosa]
MENTLDTFKAQQARALDLLGKLQRFLGQGVEAGVSIDPALSGKLQNAIDSVAGERLKVALIGGFSEGKTSIAAAWMERLDKSSMKISHQESSNEVKVYEVGEDFVLIDTPGLFGFKEQENAETHTIEKYKDITKKYVSEAHLVLYVMNSTNPIKESHKEDLTWLFRTLDLLPRTVFVLSRFDEVADVEDEQDYQANLQVKQNNVTGRLRELVGLNDQEAAELSIVAVAANPFDLGVDHWLANLEQFKALSHIATLQSATTGKIRQNGGSAALANEMRASVIRDVLNHQLPVAIENDQKVSEEVGKLDELNARLTKQLAATGQQIEDARINLREFATRYFSDLILQAKGCSLETFGDFFEREVGAEGIVLATRLQNEFSRQTQSITLEVEKMQVGFDNEVNHFNTTVSALGKQGINHLLKGNLINNTTVLAARDGITTIAKTVGMDIGKYLKFKPWGAVKFAKGANGALAALGVALEAWDSWEQYKREEAFKKAIAEMVDNFEQQRQDFLNLVNSERFKEEFFPDYLLLNSRRQELQSSLDEGRGRQQRFQAWRAEAESIDAEFKTLD